MDLLLATKFLYTMQRCLSKKDMDMCIKHKSGYKISANVASTGNLHTAGVYIINTSGLATNRIALGKEVYHDYAAAENASIEGGKILLIRFLNGHEELDFYNDWEEMKKEA